MCSSAISLSLSKDPFSISECAKEGTKKVLIVFAAYAAMEGDCGDDAKRNRLGAPKTQCGRRSQCVAKILALTYLHISSKLSDKSNITRPAIRVWTISKACASSTHKRANTSMSHQTWTDQAVDRPSNIIHFSWQDFNS